MADKKIYNHRFLSVIFFPTLSIVWEVFREKLIVRSIFDTVKIENDRSHNANPYHRRILILAQDIDYFDPNAVTQSRSQSIGNRRADNLKVPSCRPKQVDLIGN